MKLEQQVCSLELAKRLKELGVKQDGYFAWQNIEGDERGDLKNVPYFVEGRPIYNEERMEEIYSAFTVGELGELLPVSVEVDGRAKLFEMTKGEVDGGIGWTCWYLDYLYHNVSGILPQGYRDNEADARAKMLIYLLENKLITLS